MSGLSPQDFREPDAIFQVGVEPSRIDILHTISGVSTEQAWANRVAAHITDDRIPTNFISMTDLLQAKQAAARPQDLADAAKLEATARALAKQKTEHP